MLDQPPFMQETAPLLLINNVTGQRKSTENVKVYITEVSRNLDWFNLNDLKSFSNQSFYSEKVFTH